MCQNCKNGHESVHIVPLNTTPNKRKNIELNNSLEDSSIVLIFSVYNIRLS